MTSTNNIIIRPATEKDMPLLCAWCYMNGMDNLPNCEGVSVAANVAVAGDPLGFIRIVAGKNGYAHVNPVVVDAEHKREGIGRALTAFALEKYGELRFVSRGSSLGFYEKLGAQKVGWEDIDLTVTDDCDGCPMRAECNPQPMRLTKII